MSELSASRSAKIIQHCQCALARLADVQVGGENAAMRDIAVSNIELAIQDAIKASDDAFERKRQEASVVLTNTYTCDVCGDEATSVMLPDNWFRCSIEGRTLETCGEDCCAMGLRICRKVLRPDESLPEEEREQLNSQLDALLELQKYLK